MDSARAASLIFGILLEELLLCGLKRSERKLICFFDIVESPRLWTVKTFLSDSGNSEVLLVTDPSN